MIHDLQQNIEQIRMRFFDLVKKQNGMRRLINRIGQQPALVKPDIAWRRTNQARYRMAFHIFGHIKPHQLDAKRFGKLARNLGFTNACWAGKQIIANRLFCITKASTR